MTTKTKITTRIWGPALQRLNEKMESLCLRRDSYLSKVLEMEISHLEEEIPITNSEMASKYITDRLNSMDRDALTLAIPHEIAARINEVCKKRNIVRDAFFNRLIFVLAATPKQIDTLYFDGTGTWTSLVLRHVIDDVEMEYMYPLNGMIDPLWFIRTGVDLNNDGNTFVEEDDKGHPIKFIECMGDKRLADSVYSTSFGGTKDCDLRGLNCCLADWQIPTSELASHRRKRLEEMELNL